MNKKLISRLTFSFALALITSSEVFACPMCSGQDPRDKYYIYVVAVFILLIYFPMFYMFKTFFKLRNVNNQNQK